MLCPQSPSTLKNYKTTINIFSMKLSHFSCDIVSNILTKKYFFDLIPLFFLIPPFLNSIFCGNYHLQHKKLTKLLFLHFFKPKDQINLKRKALQVFSIFLFDKKTPKPSCKLTNMHEMIFALKIKECLRLCLYWKFYFSKVMLNCENTP